MDTDNVKTKPFKYLGLNTQINKVSKRRVVATCCSFEADAKNV